MAAAAPKKEEVVKPVYVAIIGTAGRNEDASKMNKEVFDSMVAHARRVIHDEWKLTSNHVFLVSGGSAWADHVAVALYNELREKSVFKDSYAGLLLYFPTHFNIHARVCYFTDDDNSGPVLNRLHQEFSHSVCRDTLEDIRLAIVAHHALRVESAKGFHARNALVAERAQRVIAFTWGEDKNVPKDGGTLHTWSLSKADIKLHVPIGALMKGEGNVASSYSHTPLTKWLGAGKGV